ncbi:hypothetical protein SY88_08145 [Clostridiales bacterium PH28_bin88]|nr:hypothetical protein SY88_08145 [Clostridiales bacterium PH28_bin88]
MEVTIRATGIVRDYFPPGQDRITVRLDRPLTVKEILVEKLGINPDVLMAVLVDGRYRSRDYVLAGGEEITLVPPLGGG